MVISSKSLEDPVLQTLTHTNKSLFRAIPLQSNFFCEDKADMDFMPIHICTTEGCDNPKHRSFLENQCV